MMRSNESMRFMIQAFYPSLQHGKLYPYMLGTIETGKVGGIRISSHAMPNAEPFKNKKFPLIIFVPGLGATRQQYTILCEELASHGYVIFSIDQPFVSSFVKFPDETSIVLTKRDAWKVGRDRDYRYKYFDEALEEGIKNIVFIMDNLDGLNIKEVGNIIDKNAIILMGHSFGGNIAHILGFKDDRIKAVVDIDSKITERAIGGKIGVTANIKNKPVLFIRAMLQYQEDVGSQLTKITEATLWEPEVQHSAFSDNAYLAVKIKDFGYDSFISRTFNWFFKRGPHFSKIDTNIGTKDSNKWFKEYTSFIINWLHKIKTKKWKTI